MSRFVCSLLVFLLALPMFAQDDPAVLGQPLPRDPALLMRMRERLSLELQQTQQMLGFVNPNDTQLVETLKTRQAEFAQQLNDVITQLQTLNTSPPGMSSRWDDMPGRPNMLPPGGMGMMPPGAASPMPSPSTREQELLRSEMLQPYSPMPSSGYPPGYLPFPSPSPPYRNDPPATPMPTNPSPPAWLDQDRAWEASSWGPRIPRELTEVKQSVESLRKEVADLKETIKALETQIQLLSRNILLSERVKENGN